MGKNQIKFSQATCPASNIDSQRRLLKVDQHKFWLELFLDKIDYRAKDWEGGEGGEKVFLSPWHVSWEQLTPMESSRYTQTWTTGHKCKVKQSLSPADDFPAEMTEGWRAAGWGGVDLSRWIVQQLTLPVHWRCSMRIVYLAIFHPLWYTLTVCFIKFSLTVINRKKVGQSLALNLP